MPASQRPHSFCPCELLADRALVLLELRLRGPPCPPEEVGLCGTRGVELLIPPLDLNLFLRQFVLAQLTDNVIGQIRYIFLLLLLERFAVIAAQRPAQDLGTVEVVHGKDGAARSS